MTTLSKEFVPYQEALELKELGFDEPCLCTYHNDGRLSRNPSTHMDDTPIDEEPYTWKNSLIHPTICTAPTFSQAFRWFREKYKLHSTITSISQESWQWHITKPNQSLGKSYDEDFYTYEEAELACLKKLIQLVKDKAS